MAVCEILCVGTELLLGDILNTNEQFLSKGLAQLGISVLHRSSVGDNPVRLAQELKAALGRSDIVITSGGLGPTADDLTKEVCCEVMGFELAEDRELSERIRGYFKARGIHMPESNLKQAMLPVGGTVFRNNHGTAPGAALERDGKCVIFLPGPPAELSPMFDESVRGFLKKYSDGTIVSHTVNIVGMGESIVAEKVEDMFDRENPTVAPYDKSGEVQLRITAKAATQAEADRLCAPVIREICDRLGDIVYGTDMNKIEERVVALLRERGKKIATAESCTAGTLPKRLTDIPGSSEVFECGIVSYSNDIKMKLLGVSPETLDTYGAVSEQTAREMALGAKRVSGADIAISTTGLAGPGGDGVLPGGLSFVAVTDGDRVFVEKIVTGHENDREYNRHVTATRALNLVRLMLEEKIK